MKTQNGPKITVEYSDPKSEIISLASKITVLDNGFKWELAKWIGIIENQMGMLEDHKEPELIGYQTEMVTGQIKLMLEKADEAFDCIEFIKGELAKMEPVPSEQ